MYCLERTESVTHSHLVIAFLVILAIGCSNGNEEPVAPTYLRIEDENGNPLTSIHFLYGIPSPTYYVKTDASPVVLSVYPSMPYGINFYSSQGEFRGTPKEYFPETTMTFTAKNMLGNITCTIQLSVGDCQLGPLVTPYFVATGSGVLTLESEGTVYYNHTLGTDDPLRHVICLPPLEYTYSFTCTSRHLPCEVYLSDNSSNYYLSVYAIIGDTKSGFFELIPTRKPTLTLSLLTAYTDEVLKYPLGVEGIHGNITVEPALPVGMEIDSPSALLKGRALSSRLQQFTVTVSNTVGTTTKEFTLAIDMCPPGMDYLLLRQRSLTDGDSWSLYDSNDIPLVEDTRYLSTKHLFCLSPARYRLDMASSLPLAQRSSRTALVLSDPLGVLAEFWIPAGVDHVTRHFAYGFPLGFGSQWRMHRGDPGKKWNHAKFDDKKWETGRNDTFGSFSKNADSLFLRGSFAPQTDRFTFLAVDIVRSPACDITLYLDAREIGRISGTESFTRFSLPVSTGVSSLLAVEIRRAETADETAPIIFDARLTGVSSSCLVQSVNGKAITFENGKWSPEFADRAFDQNPDKFWTAKDFPSILRYSFHHAHVVVNRIYLGAVGGEFPSSIRVEGITTGNETVQLLAVSSPVLLHNGEAIFDVPNNRAFPAVQLVFDGERKTGVFFTLGDARLLQCTDRRCGKRMGLEPRGIDGVVEKRCPVMSVGVRQLRCVEGDNEVTWVDDRSACGRRLPAQRIAYVDWTFELTNVTLPQWSDAKDKLNALFTDALKVASREVAYLLVRDVSVESVKLRVMTRFTLEVEIGDYVYKHLKELKMEFGEQVRTTLQRSDVEANVVEMHLREPINIGSIVLVCVTAAVILLLILFVQFVKRRMSAAKGRKSLHHLRKGADSTSLLSESV